ncbi:MULTISPECIES: hypothetical protein [Haematobacter]|uniref:Uncharacterized protein n=1 Tax=Haematobacter massiliensis TaxID=195105 RepID=A0A086Y8T8_9RHOB|nr:MULTISPECIES: hypothetical protein [Haematobacter]KFI30688.1 hypothetical protein CN97_12775 [Haematobacter massiliensis]OWJ70906.1 hypothetical protein CDV50_11265 [Haematobacter massiliensis]OWJ87446.1 hypothetical protein CDV51_06880 [Haematobacter massiliensis]QBJ24899.1 hypothetical protein HmaOT1_11985 [Haematobacter massiliensis]
MTWLALQHTWDVLTQNGNAWITGANILFMGISAGAAAVSAQAARRALMRPTPVFEVRTFSDDPWPGWHKIRIDATSSGPATLTIESISIPWFQPGRVEMSQRLMEETETHYQEYITGEMRSRTTKHLPKTDAGVTARRRISGLDLHVPPARKTRFEILAKGRLPRRLTIRYRWLDRRHLSKSQSVRIW